MASEGLGPEALTLQIWLLQLDMFKIEKKLFLLQRVVIADQLTAGLEGTARTLNVMANMEGRIFALHKHVLQSFLWPTMTVRI